MIDNKQRAVIREKRLNALAVYKGQVDEEAESKFNSTTNNLKNQQLIKNYWNFSYTDQHQIFNFDPPDYKHDNKSDTLDSNQLITSNQSNASGASSGSKPLSSFFNKLTSKQPHHPGGGNNTRSKSPFKFMTNRLSREPSPMNQSTGGASTATAATGTTTAAKRSAGRTQGGKAANAAAAAAAAKVSRSSEFGIKTLPANVNAANNQQLNVNTTSTVAAKTASLGRKSIQPQPSPPQFDEFQAEQQQDYALMESDDVELQAIIDYVDEYYYGVRIFPGQDASKVRF